MCIAFCYFKRCRPERETYNIAIKLLCFNTYTCNIAPCKSGDVALEEPELVRYPLLTIRVVPGPITRLLSSQLPENCPSTRVPLVNLLTYNIQN